MSDATAPVEVGALDTPDVALDVYSTGELAFVADGGGGVRILNVSDPASLAEVGSLETPSAAVDVFVSEGRVYVADRFAGIQIY